MLSVVTTLYRSEATVEEFHRRMAASAEAVARPVEFVYVNDGSPDRSLERALELRRGDPRISIVDLARNFGHHPALMAGIEAATGDFVFLIDSDLEEAPELLPLFWQTLNEDPQADSVYGVQVRRKGGAAERLLGRLWYALFCRMADVPYPADSLTARLMTRRFADAVLLHKERDVDMMGIFALVGHGQIAVPADKGSKGRTSYTPGRRVKIALTGLTAFSTAPITIIAGAGLLLTLGSVAAGAALGLAIWCGALRFGTAGAVLWSVWLLGGLLLTAIGIVGLYAAKILQEAKARPRAIVRRVYAGKPDDA